MPVTLTVPTTKIKSPWRPPSIVGNPNAGAHPSGRHSRGRSTDDANLRQSMNMLADAAGRARPAAVKSNSGQQDEPAT